MHGYHLAALVEGGRSVRRELDQGVYEPVIVDSRLGHSHSPEASALGSDDKSDKIGFPVNGPHAAYHLNPIRVVDSGGQIVHAHSERIRRHTRMTDGFDLTCFDDRSIVPWAGVAGDFYKIPRTIGQNRESGY
jgi:hypothetical protein